MKTKSSAEINEGSRWTSLAVSMKKGTKMAVQIEEEFISGFCKLQNQTRMVICEVAYEENGERRIESSDCAYGKCEHTRGCLLMGQIVKQNRSECL